MEGKRRKSEHKTKSKFEYTFKLHYCLPYVTGADQGEGGAEGAHSPPSPQFSEMISSFLI